MTTWLACDKLGQAIEQSVPGAVEGSEAGAVWVRPDRWREAARYMREAPDLAFDFLNDLCVVDFVDHFQVVYYLTSLAHNHGAVVKARCPGRDDPAIASVTEVWAGADFMEREAYDLMGVRFAGHPALKRLLLWEGYEGHPLRKDYVEAPFPYTWPHGG